MTNVHLFAALLVLFVSGMACSGHSTSPANSATVSGSLTATAVAGSPTNTPRPGEEPTIPPSQQTYTVQAGDTMYSIAARFGTSVTAIAQANGISDPAQINVGQVLVIPLAAGQTPAPSTPAASGAPGTQPPSGGGPAQVISIGNTSRNAVAFTFDAGADEGYTTQILDTLQANSVHATFGMTGKFAQQNPQLVQRMVNEGDTLINHTYDHASWTGNSTGAAPLTQQQRWDELDQTESMIEQLTGATTLPYFRPPYGDYDQSVLDDVGGRGYAYSVMWTVDSRGWTGIPAPQITQRCLDNATPGAIYIFHVGSASQDGVALQDVIDVLRAKGYAIGDLGSVLAP
ncbi:MAG: polysaccharide deacetylase family protein [Chloroflexota bacterium]|nr:polysaccharide deacetylase family protein [Chloroflexota bacterium]